MFALAALVLGACTSDDIVLNDSVGKTVETGGDGYISLAINLPTTPSTRANDVFDDGLAAEYAVNDATLHLFAGESEATATYYASYDLGSGDWNKYESTTDNITSRQQFTRQIDTPTEGDIYALVVLNNNGLFTTAETAPTGTTPNLVVGQTTLSTLQNTAVNTGGSAGMTTTGFYMCNAPLIDTKGSTSDPSAGEVTTLTKIDHSKIYQDAAEAESHPATEVYVERGMAKVTLQVPESGYLTIDLDGTTYWVDIDAFGLDLTNHVTYLVRNTTTDSKELDNASWWGLKSGNTGVSAPYRMAGNVEVGGGLYRTYWAVDPNYNTHPYEGGVDGEHIYGDIMDYNPDGKIGDDLHFGDAYPKYCLENTFSVANQNQDESTDVLIKTTFINSATGLSPDFYVWDGNTSKLFLEEDILTELLEVYAANGYVEQAANLWVGGETNDLYDHITVSFVPNGTGTDAGKVVASDNLTFTVTFDDEINASNFEDKETGTYFLPDVFDPESEVYAEVLEELNEEHTVAYYQEGVVYYSVMIKHFGDDLTPWDYQTVTTDENADASNYNESYPDNIWSTTADNNWLGRYGVVRNNWYDLTIEAVTELGHAVAPHKYGIPDDPTQEYISVEINILSWAKRTQSEEL